MSFIKRVTDSKKVHKWFKKAKFVARGARAKLFEKESSGYPLQEMMDKGKLVKVICKSNLREGKLTFLEMKLAHALFPQNTPNPVDFRLSRGVFRSLTEIHLDPVPVHKELVAYQNKLSESQYRFGHNRKLPEWGAMKKVYAEKGGVAHEIATKMLGVGINVDLFHGNITNVSLHDPKRPVFFEPQIIGVDVLRDWAFRLNKPALRQLCIDKKTTLERFIEVELSGNQKQNATVALGEWWHWIRRLI